MLPPDQEKEWLLEIAQGDERAFTRIFEQYHHCLGRHIYAITKSEEVAEEIVQDTFLKIWISRETLAEINNFKAYLFTISRNAAISALRKSLKQQINRAEWEKTASLLNNEGWEEKEEKLSIIDEAIEALHPQRKKVFVLFRQKGWTCDQVAKEMGISPLTVRSHIQQATAAITKYVKREANIPIVLAWIISRLF